MVKIQTGHGSPGTLYESTDTEVGSVAKPLVVSSEGATSTTATTSQTTVSATAVLILAANTARLGASIENPAGPNIIYWGGANTVTTATGFPIPAGAAYNIDIPNYTGAVWAITTGSGQLSAVIELT